MTCVSGMGIPVLSAVARCAKKEKKNFGHNTLKYMILTTIPQIVGHTIREYAIESANALFHQKQRIYQYSTLDWQLRACSPEHL